MIYLSCLKFCCSYFLSFLKVSYLWNALCRTGLIALVKPMFLSHYFLYDKVISLRWNKQEFCIQGNEKNNWIRYVYENAITVNVKNVFKSKKSSWFCRIASCSCLGKKQKCWKTTLKLVIFFLKEFIKKKKNYLSELLGELFEVFFSFGKVNKT